MIVIKNIVVVLPTVLSARIATVIQLISHLLIVAVVWEDSCIHVADTCTVSVSYKSICGTDVFHICMIQAYSMLGTGIFHACVHRAQYSYRHISLCLHWIADSGPGIIS